MFTRESRSTGPGSPRVIGFWDEATGSCQYLVIDDATQQGALIDVVLDFDPASARTSTDCARTILERARQEEIEIVWILDTHPHADHFMASAWLGAETGAPTGIGEKVCEIADLWEAIYHTPGAFDPPSDFDRLFADGDTFQIGGLEARVMLSPGHTLGSVTYVIGDAAFVNDTFMHVDFGTARADFPGGSSADLYGSLQSILALPDETRLFIGHDYPPVDNREEPAWEATVTAHREHNPHLAGGVTKDEYCELRDERDATLDLPDRMLHALQVNLRGGRFPAAEADGRHYLKMPLNHF